MCCLWDPPRRAASPPRRTTTCPLQSLICHLLVCIVLAHYCKHDFAANAAHVMDKMLGLFA